MKVQLLSFPGCPNADAAREALRRAMATAGLPPEFEDIDVTGAGTPESLRNWGSPTILIDGRDIMGGSPSGRSCRIDRPSVEAIVRALRDAHPSRRGLARSFAMFPGAALSLLPGATCPACIAAYGGVLSALGVGFVLNEAVLAPLIGVFLVAGVASAAWSARSHRRSAPLVATILGSAAIVIGRLVWSVPVVLYGGVALLIGASLWNYRLNRPRSERLIQTGFAREKEGTP